MKRETGGGALALAPGLKTALMNEVDGREFYRMAAANASTEGARDMFEFLMREEERHYEALLDQAGRLAKGKPLRFRHSPADRKALRRFHGTIFTADAATEANRAEGEMAALSIGMTLEQRAIRQFQALRKKAEAVGDEGAASVFAVLVAWEQDHLEMLSRQHEHLREMYWGEAHFWPF